MNHAIVATAGIYSCCLVLLAQIPGADEAIKTAVGSGYEAVLVAMIVLSGFALFCWAIRGWITQAAARETRQAERITKLEEAINERLFRVAIDSTAATNAVTTALQKLTEALQTTRPCWWSAEKQGQVLAEAADRIAEHLIQIVEHRLAEKWAAMKGGTP